jgi:hypothetical protein
MRKSRREVTRELGEQPWIARILRMSQKTLAESLLLNRGRIPRPDCIVMGDLLIERDRARGCILLPVGAKRRGPQQLHGAPPDLDPKVWRSSLTESAGTRRPRRLASEVVFCFPALRFDAFSPYRDSRYCCAPKPGKEKHKSYDYRSAILMVHRFRSFLSVFTPVLRKIWRKVTQKNPDDF